MLDRTGSYASAIDLNIIVNSVESLSAKTETPVFIGFIFFSYSQFSIYVSFDKFIFGLEDYSVNVSFLRVFGIWTFRSVSTVSFCTAFPIKTKYTVGSWVIADFHKVEMLGWFLHSSSLPGLWAIFFDKYFVSKYEADI